MDPDLALTQWLSPAFPVGGFAYSHGLEQAVSDGAVRDAAGLQRWLEAVLADGAGLADAVLLKAALEGDVAGATGWARALAASAERAREAEEQGAAFARTVAALGAEAPAAPLPVAVGAAARGLGLPAERVAARYLLAFAGNLVSAAVRLVPLGQTEGQAVLARLHPLIARVAARAATLTPEEVASAVPGGDLAAMRHETKEVRLFRT